MQRKTPLLSVTCLGILLIIILHFNFFPYWQSKSIAENKSLADHPTSSMTEDDFLLLVTTNIKSQDIEFNKEEGLAYVANWESEPGFQIFDVSNSPKLTSLANLSLEGQNGYPVYNPTDKFVYMVGRFSEWRAINVTDPSNPVVTSTINTGDCCDILKYNKGYIYVSLRGSGIQTYNAMWNPSNPTYVSTYYMPAMNEWLSIHPSLDLAFIDGPDYKTTKQNDEFYIFDVSDPSSLRIIKKIFRSNQVAFDSADPYKAYVMSQWHGMYLLDLSNKQDITILKNFTSIKACHAAISGDLLVTCNWVTNEVLYFNISDRMNPILIKSVLISAPLSPPRDIEFYNNQVYISCLDGLVITKNPLSSPNNTLPFTITVPTSTPVDYPDYTTPVDYPDYLSLLIMMLFIVLILGIIAIVGGGLALAHSNKNEEAVPFGEKSFGVREIYASCPNCGQERKPDSIFCPVCGHRFGLQLQIRFCPNCGQERKPDYLFCLMCGHRFDLGVPGED